MTTKLKLSITVKAEDVDALHAREQIGRHIHNRLIKIPWIKSVIIEHLQNE